IPGSSRAAVSRKVATAASFAMSTVATVRLPGSPSASPRRLLKPAALMSPATTLAPSRTRARAKVRPRPRAAPVTMAWASFKCMEGLRRGAEAYHGLDVTPRVSCGTHQKREAVPLPYQPKGETMQGMTEKLEENPLRKKLIHHPFFKDVKNSEITRAQVGIFL